ncbi:MAG TPA: hypothetical protein VIJ68_03720 [Candidatus Saccharimonadales bacterium]
MADSLELIKGEGFETGPGEDWKKFADEYKQVAGDNSEVDPSTSYKLLGAFAGSTIAEHTGLGTAPVDVKFIGDIAGRFATRAGLVGEPAVCFEEGVQASVFIRVARSLAEEAVEQAPAGTGRV